jgi:hypothetical protein
MTTEQKIMGEAQRYLRAQQVKIATQREFIHDLERSGQVTRVVRLEKETLGEMIKSLDLVLCRLRPVIERVG